MFDRSPRACLRRGAALAAVATLVCAAPPAAGQTAQGGPGAGFVPYGAAGPRSLYVWDGGIPASPAETKALLRFAEEQGIGRLLLEAGAVGYGGAVEEQDFGAFVQRAHARGIEVFALLGNPWFTVPADAGVPGQESSQAEALDVFRTVLDAAIDWDGAVDNSLPYLTDWSTDVGGGNWFFDHLPHSAQSYLDHLRALRELAGDLPFHHAIPFWYDLHPALRLALDGEAVARPLNEYVQGSVDGSLVLAYRDHAHGPDGVLVLSLGEVLAGPCTIVLETSDLGPLDELQTFWEEGPVVLEQELFAIWSAYRAEPGFQGIALHHYESYFQLVD